MKPRWTWLPVLAILCFASTPGASAQTPSTEARLATRALLLDAAVAGSRIVTVGQRGHALYSDDGGATWTQAVVPAQPLLTAVHMHDAETGWAVGHDAAILRTQDGGVTWELTQFEPDWQVPLLDIWFRDTDRGFAVGAFGLLLHTEDGGSTWSCGNGCWSTGIEESTEPPLLHAHGSEFEDDFHLNAIAPASAERVFLAGEAGALYRSDDGGRRWEPLLSPYEGSWYAALALDQDILLVAGLRGNLFRSDDAGKTWTRIETGTTATITSLVRTRSGSVLATGLAGEILLSTDGGTSFSRRPLHSRQGLSTALEISTGEILLFGEDGLTTLPGMP